MLDDFREWLSDYLRYFMLGGAILLVVLILFLGVRACSGGKESTNKQDEQQKTEVTPTAVPQENEEDKEEEEDTNPLVENDTDVAELIKEYYKAFGEKDIDGLKNIVTDLSPTDEAKITNAKEYIEGYEVTTVYTKAGLEEDTYVVYACYEMKCSGIETTVPMLSQLYVVTDEDGKLAVDASEDEEVISYMEAQLKEDDVLKLKKSVQKANEQAQEKDEALAEFLSGLGEESSAETITMTVNDGCNVRAEAVSGSEIIGGYDVGTEVEVYGMVGEWYQVDYEGEIGYIYNTLLD